MVFTIIEQVNNDRFRQSHYGYEERRTCRSDRGYRIPPWRWRCFPVLPANSLLHYEVELIDFIEGYFSNCSSVCICELSVRPDKFIEISISWHPECIQFSQLRVLDRNNHSGKLEACERKKLDGNVLFKAGKFWRASKKLIWEGLFRRSQAYLKTSELEKAEAEADIKKALPIDHNNRYV